MEQAGLLETTIAMAGRGMYDSHLDGQQILWPGCRKAKTPTCTLWLPRSLTFLYTT